jgi:hypothetical protein
VQDTVELCLRAQARQGAIGPGYVRRIAWGFITRECGMHHEDARATRILSRRVHELEQAQGHEATEAQTAALAEEIRANWDGSRRPSATFYRRTRVVPVDMAAQGDALAAKIDVVSDAATAYEEYGTSVAAVEPDQAALDLLEAHENATGKAEHMAVRRAAWDALASSSGAPPVRPPLSKGKVAAIRKVMTKSAGGLDGAVRQAMTAWDAGEDNEYTSALFAPFAADEPAARDAVVKQLRSSGSLAPQLWAAALSASSSAHQAV